MSLPIVKVDEDYKHESLEWLYRLKIKKLKRGATAVRERFVRVADFERLVALSEIEHADCDESCEVRQALASIA